MDIAKIDKNFALPGKVERDDVVWYDVSEKPFDLYGAVQANPYLRMPDEVAATVSENVRVLNHHTAGVRARFRTDSPFVAIRVEWESQCRNAGMSLVATAGFDLYEVCTKTARQKFLHTIIPPFDCEKGYESIVNVKGYMTDYLLNFPLYNPVTRVLVGVKEGSLFEEAMKYSNELPVVYYGSSITQGGCASRPGICYQNYLSRRFDVDYVNLGFSGSAVGEDEIIDYLASLEMSVFVSDYDHNANTPERLLETHEKLYRAVRAKHPDVPYIIISRPDFWRRVLDEPCRSVIMQTYQKAWAEGDKNVYFIDGASIFAGDEYDSCTLEGTHPNDLGFYRFFQALQPVFERIF
ncbi:MAG: hypothetical protein IKJ35_04345 [Clostridia bacterium]|nr:hypothetical protein [Clostridia bacterium]